jgi:hypothetical protein
MQLLSACVLAMVSLLRPLIWAGPLIVTLPQKLYAYLDSPVPLVIGVEALPRGFAAPLGMVILEPLANKVTFHPKEAEGLKTLVAHQVAHLLEVMGLAPGGGREAAGSSTGVGSASAQPRPVAMQLDLTPPPPPSARVGPDME